LSACDDAEDYAAAGDAGHLVGGESAEPAPARTGSEALGISECDVLGYQPQINGHCRFSAFVCAGFRTRAERVRHRKET